MGKAYVLPFVLYLLGTALVAQIPSLYPLAYALVVVSVAATTIGLLRGRRILAPHWRALDAVIVGLLGIALWIGLSELRLEDRIAEYLPGWLRAKPRVGFNPFAEFAHPVAAWSFVAVRIGGLGLLVPVVEELFWRGFLARWLVAPEWEEVPLGKFTVKSFLLVTLFFTLAHPEWFAAAVYCVLINGLLIWKKDIWKCVVAHAVSNLTLAVYILMTGTWSLW